MWLLYCGFFYTIIVVTLCAFVPPGFEEVTTRKADGSIGAMQQCGDDTSEGRKMCVAYNLCNARTGYIDQSGMYDGFGIIDIRAGVSQCPGYLEKCCKIPDNIPNVDPTPSTSAPPPPPPVPQPPPNGENSNHCGIKNDNGIDFKITGNTDNEAEYGEFPWMIEILRNGVNDVSTESQQVALCGGSLIAPNVVLTGAHCVYNMQPNDIKIRAGEWDTQTTDERLPYQERNVAQIIVHEEFNPDNLFNDVALLILGEYVYKAEHIGTICLPRQQQKVVSRNCFASGWGKNRFGKKELYQVILKKIELPVVERRECEKALRTTRLGSYFKLHSSFICAGGEEGKDTCTGDGGGPLVCPDPENPNRYLQVGIVAWGIGCGEQQIPGVYADVAQFRGWIDNQMQRLNLNTESYNL